MKLREYLDQEGLKQYVFCRKLGVTESTLYSILCEKRDLRLSLALKIEDLTDGKVKCKDLLPEKFKNKKGKVC